MKSVLIILIMFASSLANAKWEPCNNSHLDAEFSTIESNGKIMVAATVGRGVFISTDNGNNWIDRSQGLNSFIYSLAIINDNIFVGTSYGIYYSTNNGTTWTERSQGLTNKLVNSIEVNGDKIYAGTQNGLFLSSDNGNNWIQIGSVFINEKVQSVKAVGSNVFVITNNNFYHSTDSGNNWSVKNNGLPSNYLRKISNINNELFVATLNGLYYSNDNGNNWEIIFPQKSIYGLSVSKELIVFDGTNSIFLSIDKGKSWVEKKYDNKNNNETVFTSYNSGNNIVLCTYSGKIYKSTDRGDTWTQTNNNLFKTKLNAFSISGNKLIAGSDDGVFISNNSGDNWYPQNMGLDNLNVLTLSSTNDMIFVATKDGIFKTNSEFSWESSKKWGSLSDEYSTAMAIDGNNIISATSTGNIYKSTNIGKDWEKYSNPFGNKKVLSFCFSNGLLYAGTTGGLFISTNNGENWIESSTGILSNSMNDIRSVNGIMYAATGGTGVYSSTDKGENWKERNNGLTSKYIRMLYSFGNTIFAATLDGVFLTNDKGENWIEINDGLINKNVLSIIVSGEYVFAGTNSDGVFRAKLGDFGITDVEDISLENLLIYPNPARDFITITIPDNPNHTLKGMVENVQEKVQIFNTLGIEVSSAGGGRSEVDGGRYRIDISNLPAGVYFVRIGVKEQKFVKL